MELQSPLLVRPSQPLAQEHLTDAPVLSEVRVKWQRGLEVGGGREQLAQHTAPGRLLSCPA